MIDTLSIDLTTASRSAIEAELRLPSHSEPVHPLRSQARRHARRGLAEVPDVAGLAVFKVDGPCLASATEKHHLVPQIVTGAPLFGVESIDRTAFYAGSMWTYDVDRDLVHALEAGK